MSNKSKCPHMFSVFILFFPLICRGKGYFSKLPGAEAVHCFAEEESITEVELKALIQIYFIAKLLHILILRIFI